MKKLAIIGAGTIGSVAARKLIEKGYSVYLYDSDQSALDSLSSLGANIMSHPTDQIDQQETVLLFLPGPREIESCVAGANGLIASLPEQSALIDLSTTSPESTQKLARLAGEKGIGYLDAPILGRPSNIGNWTLPVGGPRDHLERRRPILETIAAKVVYVGDSGSGNKIKLLNQLMFGAINTMTAEMMAIAECSGVDPQLLFETLSSSQASTVSKLFLELCHRIVKGNYENPTFTVNLLSKDIQLAVDFAEKYGQHPVLGNCIREINRLARESGLGESDTAAVWTCLLKHHNPDLKAL